MGGDEHHVPSWSTRARLWFLDSTRCSPSSQATLPSDQWHRNALPPPSHRTNPRASSPPFPSPLHLRPTDVPTPSLLPPANRRDRAAAALAGKRVKFAPNNADNVAADPDADDLQLDLDQDGAGPSRKKGKVTTEGYDSDSSADSDGGFGGAGGGRKGRGVGAQAGEPDADEEEDDDMFGGSAEARDTGLDTKGKKKEKEFLEMGDIEGQEFGRGDNSDNEGEAEDELEDDEEDYLPEDDEANADEAPRGRRSKKGMGYALRCVSPSRSLD